MTTRGAWARRLALLFTGLLLAIVACDLTLGLAGLDQGMIRAALYLNRADAEVYEISDDPVLHYRMRPGAERPDSGQPGDYGVTVNAWGARGVEHPWDKPPGAFRILHFGGSTVFGALVDDHQTLSAQLEDALSVRTGRPVEVWNLGHSAYVQSQAARLAQLELERVPGVDLLLLTITNASLRAWLDPAVVGDVDYRRFFQDDPYLWLETFPRLPAAGLLGHERATGLHLLGLRRSAIYRYVQARQAASAPRDPDSPAAKALCKHELLELEALAASMGVPVVYANHPARQGAPEPEARGMVIELDRPDRGPAWTEVHPPPAILEGWADVLAGELLGRGLVPGDKPRQSDQDPAEAGDTPREERSL
jgi:hypothetical protein